jgi:hypothetical protein
VFLFVLPVLGVFVVVAGLNWLFHQSAVLAKLNDWKLVPQSEPVTELYLNDYLTFPDQIVKGMTVPFSFTIHNLEGKYMTYPYGVYLQTVDGVRIAIASSSVSLADTESRKISESYTFASNSAGVTVFIELPSVGEELHFALPTRIHP